MIRACAFDLGNTLINDTELYDRSITEYADTLVSRGAVHRATEFKEVYDAVNYATVMPYVSHTFGEPEFFERTFRKLGVQGIDPEAALAEYRSIAIRNTTLDSDIRETIALLGRRGIVRAVLSNERAARIDGFFVATKCEALFEHVIVSERIGVEKPDRAFFELALQEIGTAPAETVMFGDNTIADGACRMLGMPFVHVTAYATTRWYFEQGSDNEADYVLPEITPSEMDTCLVALGRRRS